MIYCTAKTDNPGGQTGAVTTGQLELISADPAVMHGQAVLAGTRVPASVILDCLAAGMTAEGLTGAAGPGAVAAAAGEGRVLIILDRGMGGHPRLPAGQSRRDRRAPPHRPVSASRG